VPGTDVGNLAIGKLPADAPAKPELSFRDRLMQLDNVGPTIQIAPGFTTKDSTPSYSTSAGIPYTTHDTTSSYSTSAGPGLPPRRNTTSSYTTIPDPQP
jgi:hypothetical protein